MKAIEILKLIDNANMRLDAIKIIEHFQNEAYDQALKDVDKAIAGMNAVEHTITVRNKVDKLKKSVSSTD